MEHNLDFSSFIGGSILISGMGILIGLFLWPLVYYTIGKKFDCEFKPISKGTLALGPMARAMWYAFNITLGHWKSHKSIAFLIFKDYDFWKHATTFERIVSCIFVSTTMTALALAVIPMSVHFYNYITGTPGW